MHKAPRARPDAAADLEDAVLVALRDGGAQPVSESGHTWIELRVRDPHRY